MVKIRLARVGSKNQPKYRIVVAEERFKATGRTIEVIGHYDPTRNPYLVEMRKDRYLYWQERGAQATIAVKNLVRKMGK